MGKDHVPSPIAWPSLSLGLMSIRKPVSFAARRAFCPSRPIASESWLRGTSTVAVRVMRSIVTLSALAGPRAAATNASASSDQGTMSTCSLASSLRIARCRTPFGPTHAPTGSRPGSVEDTAIFVRRPGSRALEVMDMAKDCVLRGLGRHPLELFGRQLTDFHGAVVPHSPASHVERAGLCVELDHDFALRGERTLVRGRERDFNRVQHLLEWNAQLGAKRGQRFGQALRGRLRLRPRACPRQRLPMRCE